MWCRNVKKQTYKAVLVCRKFFSNEDLKGLLFPFPRATANPNSKISKVKMLHLHETV